MHMSFERRKRYGTPGLSYHRNTLYYDVLVSLFDRRMSLCDVLLSLFGVLMSLCDVLLSLCDLWGAGIWTLHCLTFNAFLISDVLYSRTMAQSGSSWYKGLIMSSKVKRSGSFSTENATWSQLIDPPSYDNIMTSEVEGFRGCFGDWHVWDSNETETYRYTNIVFIIRKEMIHFSINLFKGKQ